MTVAASDHPPLRTVRWEKTFRLIPSRYPPIDLFERIADPGDWESLAQIEGLTNDRLRDEIGDISLVPVSDRLVGQGASPIMAAFTHIGFASRFTDGSFGVYYASDCFEGGLHEVLHHTRQFLERTSEPKTYVDLRTYIGRIDASLHDIRGGWELAHDPASHAHARVLGVRLRMAGSNGIVFDNVRYPHAANIAIFRPLVLAASPGKPHVLQGAHIRVEWDGARTSRYIVMGETTWKDL